MPRELYNEGRVVGLSTYELYVKHALSENPNIQPASEREWLASQLGHGASMILHIPVEIESVSGVHCIEVPLPENSTLCSANTVIGSQFFGTCLSDQNGWAVRVQDYGSMLPNNSLTMPSEYSVNSNPHIDVFEFTESQQASIANYLKVQDAIIVQPGLWEQEVYSEEGDNLPIWDFIPNLKSVPVVRLTLTSRITQDFYILLTGFTNRNIISGISGFDSGSVQTDNPENGDFIGPESFPWANKVILTTSSATEYYLRKNMSSQNDFLKIDVDDNSLSTEFTVSPLNPGTGISVHGPVEPGGDVLIGAKIGNISETIPQNRQGGGWSSVLDPYIAPYRDSRDNKADTSVIYASDVYDSSEAPIDISQIASTENDAIVTEIKHSKLIAGTGIAISGPTENGGDIKISSRIEPYNTSLSPDNKMLKVIIDSPIATTDVTTGQPHISPRTVEEGVRTRLKVSKPVNDGNGGVRLKYPENAGDNIYVSVPMSSNFLDIKRTTPDSTTLNYKSGGITDKDGILKFNVSGGKCQVTWDYSKLATKLATNANKNTLGISNLEKGLADLLRHISGVNSTTPQKTDGSVNWLTLGQATAGDFKIPCGTLNIYSKTSANKDVWLKSHTSAQNGDIRVK